MCQDVEANARRHPTVVTQDPYHLLLVELWHRCGGDLLIKLLPHGRHVAGGTRAYRTCVVVMSSHLVQAFQMDRVPAVQYTDVHRRVKQILEADRAVVMHCSFYTVMRILQDIAVATPAFFAVKVITATSSETKRTKISKQKMIILKKILNVPKKKPKKDNCQLGTCLQMPHPSQ